MILAMIAGFLFVTGVFMKKFFLLLLLVLFSFTVYAEEVQKDNVFYFFYSYKCPHCHEAQPFIAAIEHE